VAPTHHRRGETGPIDIGGARIALSRPDPAAKADGAARRERCGAMACEHNPNMRQNVVIGHKTLA